MSGLVSIVGAGPGDPGLLTLRAADRLRRCDCVVYDHLASPRLLTLTPAGCEQIYAGKEAGNHALPQEALNALLAQKAKEGKRVVRLKGGDPYVFGRGGEEALYLKGAGVPFEVVPGVTSAVAGPCCAGIPITHRGLATSFHVYTAASRTGEDPVDWAAAARQEGTLVFLMGLSRLENTCRKLLENGLPPDTPAAVVSRATTPLQRTVRAPLGELAAAVRVAKLPPPAITVVGQVASLGGALGCFEERPLFGRTVVTTRQKTHGFDLSATLEEAGARVERLDAIRIRPCPGEDLQRAFSRLGEYSYLIFTSQNAVRIFLEELRRSGRDLRALAGPCLCAVGPATAAALAREGLAADLTPPRHTSAGLWEVLGDRLGPDDRVLYPRAKAVRGKLGEWLPTHCPTDQVVLYETLEDARDLGDALTALRGGEADYLTFTSPSAVESTLRALGPDFARCLAGTKIVSIGPVTSGCLRAHGLEPALESGRCTAEEMAQLIVEDGRA